MVHFNLVGSGSRLGKSLCSTIPHSSPFVTVIVQLIVALALASGAFGQSSQGVINGTVRDSQGAVIGSAQVTIRNTATGVAEETTANDAGTYALSNLKVGEYTLTVQRDGFKRYTRENIVVSTAEHIGIDVQLTLVANSILVISQASTGRSAAKRERRAVVRLVSVHQSAIRTKLMAAAVSTCCKCTLAMPM